MMTSNESDVYFCKLTPHTHFFSGCEIPRNIEEEYVSYSLRLAAISIKVHYHFLFASTSLGHDAISCQRNTFVFLQCTVDASLISEALSVM